MKTMKKALYLFIFLLGTMLVQAQTLKTIYLGTAGSLNTALPHLELSLVTSLTLTGNINARDFKTMRDSMPLLANIDLSGSIIVAYTGTAGTDPTKSSYEANAIPPSAFSYTFFNVNYYKTSLVSFIFPASITSIGDHSFFGCSGLTGSLTIPPMVTSIGNTAFCNCVNLNGTLTLPSSVSFIGESAFNSCGFTGSLNIPSSISSINQYAFAYCKDFNGVLTIPSSVTTISDNAFIMCGFIEARIPSSVTLIGYNAFNSCSNLSAVYALKQTPLNVPAINDIFGSIDKTKCTLFVPRGAKLFYQSANNWLDFKNIVEIAAVNDSEGNGYDTVRIGTQTWLKQNLNVAKYNDGTTIPNVSDVTTWGSLTTGAMCTYNNTSNADTLSTYGRLYNWYAVNTGKLCPQGYHVSSSVEWTELNDYLGGGSAGSLLKEAGNMHWSNPYNTDATNSTSFTALPGGYRSNGGMFNDISKYSYWWSSTDDDVNSINWANNTTLSYNSKYLAHSSDSKVSGFSVRCLKDYAPIVVTTTVLPTAVCAGASATLTTSVTGGLKNYSYAWSIGTNKTSELMVNPAETTTYYVTVTDANNTSQTSSVSVLVNSLPTVTATAIPTAVCSGATAKLIAKGALSYEWETFIGDSVSFTPQNSKTYSVTGTDINGCKNIAATINVVYNIPTITATAIPSKITAGANTTISASGANTYNWNNGIGRVTKKVVSPKVTTIYTVTGTDGNSCKNTTSVLITVRDEQAPTITAFPEQIAGTDKLFKPLELSPFVIDDNTPFANLKLSTSSNPYISFTISNGILTASQTEKTWTGTTTVNLTAEDEQGLKTVVAIPYTQPYLLQSTIKQPTVNFSANKTFIKPGDIIRFNPTFTSTDTAMWSFGMGKQISGTYLYPTVRFDSAGVYTITLTAKNSIGSPMVMKKNYVVVSTLNMFDSTICKGNFVTLSVLGSGFSSYLWSNGQNTASITVSPTKATVYKVLMKKGLSIYTDSIRISLAKQPDLGNDTSFCQGGSLTLSPGTFSHYYWNGSETEASSSITTTKPETITVKTIDERGCVAFDTITINQLYPKPIVKLGNDTSFCWKKKLTLNAGNASAQYKWSTGATKATIDVTTSNTYSVTVIDSKTCVNADTIKIEVLVPIIPTLGIVTHSITSDKNVIGWEPLNNKGIKQYNLKRETNVTGVFETIQTINKNDSTYFVDPITDINTISHSYVLTSVDSACGNESDTSVRHTSILLSCVLSDNNKTVTATWNNYDGFHVSNYKLYRAEKGKPLQVYMVVPAQKGAVTKFIDTNPLGYNSYYRVGFDVDSIKPGLLKSDSGPFSMSLSNLAESKFVETPIITIDAEITTYPNPTNGKFSIDIYTDNAKNFSFELVNVLGQKVYDSTTGIISEKRVEVDASNFNAGLYMLRIVTNDGVEMRQIVITR